MWWYEKRHGPDLVNGDRRRIRLRVAQYAAMEDTAAAFKVAHSPSVVEATGTFAEVGRTLVAELASCGDFPLVVVAFVEAAFVAFSSDTVAAYLELAVAGTGQRIADRLDWPAASFAIAEQAMVAGAQQDWSSRDRAQAVLTSMALVHALACLLQQMDRQMAVRSSSLPVPSLLLAAQVYHI